MKTVIGKCSLEDPVSDEDSMGVAQFDYFEKVLENLITTEERVEQLRELRCRAMRWMTTATGPQQQRKAEQQHYARKDFNKPRDAEYVERNDHSNRYGEMFEEASTQAAR